jgi:hypothetical protein
MSVEDVHFLSIAALGFDNQFLSTKITTYAQEHKYKIIIVNLDKDINLYMKAVESLDVGGVIICYGGLKLVYELVKQKLPVVIAEEDRRVSIVFPLDETPAIDTETLTLSRDMDYWGYINWYNAHGNKNIICRWRFVEHIFYNRFHETKRFL